MGSLRDRLRGQRVYLDANCDALMQGCTAMLTNDDGFRRAPDLTLFLLSEWGAPSC